MDDMRVCGNGHLFPFGAGSCPQCDSKASRPATPAEAAAVSSSVRSGEQGVRMPDADEGSLGGWIITGISVAIVSSLIGFVAVSADSILMLLLSYGLGVAAFLLILVGVIAVGVREGMDAHAARQRRNEAVVGAARPSE